MHMKIKHQAGSKTDREKFARELVLHIRAGHDLSGDQLSNLKTLPPGLLEQSAQELGFLHDLLNHAAFRQVKKRLEPFLIAGGY